MVESSRYSIVIGDSQSFVTIGLLEQELRADGRHSEFLIDGFPRNYENMVRWQELMDRKTRF